MTPTTFPKPTITKLISGRLGLLNPNDIWFNQHQSTLGSLEYLYFGVYYQNVLHFASIYYAPHNIHDERGKLTLVFISWEHTWTFYNILYFNNNFIFILRREHRAQNHNHKHKPLRSTHWARSAINYFISTFLSMEKKFTCCYA